MRRRPSRFVANLLVLACAVALAPQALAQDAEAAAQTPEAQFARARELAASGHREEALALYSALLQQAPGNADVQLARGRVHAWLKHWPEAEADLTAVTTARPDYADAWSALGDLYLWSGRPGEAATAYARWSELSPADPAPTLAVARARRDAGDLAAARDAYEAARARGAEAAVVDAGLASLQPRVAAPDAVLPAGYRWSARIGDTYTRFDPSSRDAWHESELAVRRQFTRGSLALELLRADRFRQHDTAWALDGYAPLWSRAYANLRYQRGPSGRLYPDNAWRAELFQGVGGGWEVSASYDHLDFGGHGTELLGAGVGRYAGNFYARYRALHVAGRGGLDHRAQLRWYYAGNADDYLEAYAGYGRSQSSDLLAFDRIGTRSHSSFGLTWVDFFAPQWGVRLGAGMANDVDGFDERHVSAMLYYRW